MSEPKSDPIHELKLLEQQLARATTMEELRPIFYRLDAISKTAGDNLDVQLGVGDLKQSLIDRGNQIKGVVAGGPYGPTPAGQPPQPHSPSGPNISGPMLSNSMQPTTAFPKDWFNNAAANPPQIPPPSQRSAPQQPPVSPWTVPQGQPAAAPRPAKKSPLGWILAVIAFLAALAGGAYFFFLRPKAVSIQIRTTPPGASITVDNQPKCTSNCEVMLPAGKHEVSVKLDGYAPATASLTVDAETKSSASVDVPLVPVPQSLRIHSDLGAGTIALDNESPALLKDSEFLREAIAPGHHTVKVSAGGREVKFSFDITPGGLPALSGTVSTRNALAVMVSSMGAHGRLATSSGPWKVNLNGVVESEAGPAGVELKAFKAGENELVIGEGAEERRIKGTFDGAPSLTVFLKQAQDAGTLTIATREDGVRVFINDRELPARTAGGQVRLRLLGPVKVRVVKDGFEVSQPKTAEILRDQDVRMLFSMTAKPTTAAAVVAAAKPVASVRADDEHPPVVTARPESKTPEIPPSAVAAPPPPPAAVASNTTPAPVAPQPSQKPEEAAPPTVAGPTGSMDDFENPSAWHMENGMWRHRGQGFLSCKQVLQGMFTFEVQVIRGGHARWAVDYSDPRRYTLFELDDESLGVLDVANGKRSSVAKIRHEAHSKDHRWMLQIKVSAGQVVHSVYRDRGWAVLDTRATASGKGRFGFLIQGNDEIALASFRFTPR